MIAWLKGTIVEKSADRVVLNVQDVGYEVHIPFSTYYELGNPGEPATLRIHTHVKEDILNLYGFLTPEEKKLFTLLIQISGIGPKLGIAILSGLPPQEFVQAIRSSDLHRLNGIPGVGKKTAERLLLEMRDKVADWSIDAASATGPADLAGALRSDVASALVNLGYARKEAERRVSRALQEVDTDRFEVLLKKALSQ
ncbi:MAG: Holliday junction branch migration protein RuvA [Acidobacteriota bacterium]